MGLLYICRSGPESLEHLTVCSEKFLASDGGQVQGYQGSENLEGTARLAQEWQV